MRQHRRKEIPAWVAFLVVLVVAVLILSLLPGVRMLLNPGMNFWGIMQ